jgi:hypothetical protein
MESPICCAILDCGKSLSEMLAEPTSRWNHADSCADQRACLSRPFLGIPIWLAWRTPNSDLALPFVTLSDFPSTLRFGLVVLAECLTDILANPFVLPLLGGARLKKARLRMRL